MLGNNHTHCQKDVLLTDPSWKFQGNVIIQTHEETYCLLTFRGTLEFITHFLSYAFIIS